ncbi:YggT family protein [Actinoplanes octamycinicus]|uniref:YggT family protein n=1 Tax=Actinoplanes octamycinicus TaxID=135948 RepID=A0A7W7MC48_9ACTN|nr:YggT family protein [Actinoplanes octamycinicus]MBB4744767.1 YggT family protein [Actinoplanes octamycinicus]GIE55350.1 hemolysin activation protein [Actinoplanes octamycinicus]
MGLLGIISLALLIVQFLLIARAVLDWSAVLAGPAMPGSLRSRVSGGVFAVTEPILAPVRKLIPPLRAGGVSIDLAFIIVFFAVTILRSLI